MAGKTKMGHEKFAKFQQGPGEKKKHTCGGSVCTGYTVIDPAGEIVATFEYMWDAIEKKLELNAPV